MGLVRGKQEGEMSAVERDLISTEWRAAARQNVAVGRRLTTPWGNSDKVRLTGEPTLVPAFVFGVSGPMPALCDNIAISVLATLDGRAPV
jgi:hypothetical protein